jgi:hypothetical protein
MLTERQHHDDGDDDANERFASSYPLERPACCCSPVVIVGVVCLYSSCVHAMVTKNSTFKSRLKFEKFLTF